MTRPNVVLIALDTARADEVFREESAGPVMPTVQSLASGGTRFRDAQANAPWTLPSHATLFTGEPPTVHGAHAAHKTFEHDRPLPVRLSDAGYHTVGVSNNTWISGEFGFDRGFDEFITSWQLVQDAVDFGGVARRKTGAIDQLRGVAAAFRGNPVANVANLLYGKFFRKRRDDGARRTNRLIRDRLDRWTAGEDPLFLFVNYLEPHLEYRPPREYAQEWLPEDVSYEEASAVNQDAWAYLTGEVEMSERDFRALRGLYRAELAYLDNRLEELVASFEAAGCREDTVFVITGDHGEHIGEHDLMDHQYSLSRTLLSVPLVVAGLGFDTGREVDAPVQIGDVPQTILDLAGVEDRPQTALSARSLRDPDEIPRDRPLFAEYLAPQPQLARLRADYEVTEDLSQYDRRLRAVRVGTTQYVRGSDGSERWTSLAADGTERVPEREASPSAPTDKDHCRGVLAEWVENLPPVDADSTGAIGADARTRLEELGYLQ